MNAMPQLQSPRRTRSLSLLAAMALALALGAPHVALAAAGAADSGQTVQCMLPGQIHRIAGQATMGPRRPIQTTPEDCRQQGGEYTVNEQTNQPATSPNTPTAIADDGKILNCLLPKQVRQLGEKARYTTARRPIKTTRSDCATKGGDVISSAQARKATRDYKAAQVKTGAPKTQP
ncbi:MAG TPA: hypothetical protein VK660_00460 [Xanthomonadaceae bacterium]|nr:hypothetical protein [Xanthomonadaceae bacterium]